MRRHYWEFVDRAELFNLVIRRCRRCRVVHLFHSGTDPDTFDLGPGADDCDSELERLLASARRSR